MNLSVTHVRVCPGIAEEDGDHFVLDGTLTEEVNARKSANDVLPDDSLQLLIAEELVPGARVLLAEWVVLSSEQRRHLVLSAEARVVLSLRGQHRRPSVWTRWQQTQQQSPAHAA